MRACHFVALLLSKERQVAARPRFRGGIAFGFGESSRYEMYAARAGAPRITLDVTDTTAEGGEEATRRRHRNLAQNQNRHPPLLSVGFS